MYRLLAALFLLLAIALTSFAVDSLTSVSSSDENLFQNGDFRQRASDGKSAGYQLEGSAIFCFPGDPRVDIADPGVALNSTGSSGSVSQVVDGIDINKGKRFRFTVRGEPLANFTVKNNNLFMKVEFLGADGSTTYDAKRRTIYEQVEKARKDLDVNGIRHAEGAAVWQTYQLDFSLPFPQVHQLKLSVGFGDGAASATRKTNFYVSDFKLIHIPDPPSSLPDNEKPTPAVVPAYDKLIPIGGRWFYAAVKDESAAPALFDPRNGNRLLYKDAGYSAPFAGNMTAWLHRGNVDADGNTITTERFVPDNLTITFDSTSMIMKSHGLPNHPTGAFPLQVGFNDGFAGDPSSITERIRTYYIPLEPKENPDHVVTAKDNSNHALPMGPIGIAINGVVFFNPFDANSEDATNLLDRCCGHPAPDGQYHYHKYPICVNSPWADEGKEHSPLIGFAFDGFPVYGPYESKDVMAKDVRGEGALNDFNISYDKERGWHYHVTPGKFPYLIGGYWGTEDARDKQRGPRGGGAGGPGGGRMGGGPGGPGGPGGFGPP